MAQVGINVVEDDFTKASQDKKEEFATLFSEGNKDLKHVLLTMWNNGIQTYACCAGHKKSELTNDGGLLETGDPYIFFEVSSLTDTQLKNFVHTLMLLCKASIVKQAKLDIDKMEDVERHGMTIRFYHKKDCYKILNDAICKTLKIQNENLHLKKIKQKLKEKEGETEISQSTLNFIEDFAALNAIEMTEYISSAKKTEDNYFAKLGLGFSKKMGKYMQTWGGRQGCLFSNKYGEDEYFINVAEGLFSPDPIQEGVYYTLRNGEAVKLTKDQLDGLKEYSDAEMLNFTEKYSSGTFSNVLEYIEYVKNLKKV